MNFQQSIMVCFSKYADFNGRATRSEYWWFSLFIALVYLVLAVVNEVLPGIFALATLLPTLAVTVRRLHDTERSGWWLLICLVPFIGLVLFYFLAQKTADAPLAAPQAY